MFIDITNEDKHPKAEKSGAYNKTVQEYFGNDGRSLRRKNRAQWIVEEYGPYTNLQINEHTLGWKGSSLQKDGYLIFRIGGTTYGKYSYGLFISIKPKKE